MTDVSDKLTTLLLNLKVIASIQKNERLSTRNGFQVQTSMFQGLYRWYNGENRTLNLNAVEHVFLEAVRLAHTLLDQRKTLQATPVDTILLENDQQLQNLQEGLNNALAGLACLAFTYTDSATAVARIYTMTTMVKNSLARIELKYNLLVGESDDQRCTKVS